MISDKRLIATRHTKRPPEHIQLAYSVLLYRITALSAADTINSGALKGVGLFAANFADKIRNPFNGTQAYK